MNHLLKIIKFYKSLKDNDLETITNYLSNFNIIKPNKIITTTDFNILYFDNFHKDGDCNLCFNNIYTSNNHDYIPLEINDCHFFLTPSFNQIFTNHILINDFIHRETITKNEILNMKELLNIFPLFMILSFKSNHYHYELGDITSPLFNKDATLFKDDIYKVEWYLPSFLIKDNDIETIILNFNTLNKKYQNYNSILILFKRFNKYYLYIIYQTNNNLNIYESIGLFTANKNMTLSKQINEIKIKMDA